MESVKGKFVNVDLSTVAGIKSARKNNLIERGLLEFIISSHFHAIVDLFDPFHKGRTFAMMRDPIERTLSFYNYLSIKKALF